ncbi:MAG: hypothetical protein IJ190_03540, partial [Prevotella sp.]|nr:hypothetical protein [Prevotella sp.]
MKKLFTLMAAALMAVGANAQTKLTLGAGWNSSLEDVVLTGDVEFNFKNSYASIEMDITEVDLATYPSYEIVLSSDTPSDKLQFNVVSDAGEGWSGSFAEGTTTPAAFIPDGSTKLTKIALQACNFENLGKVEIVSANLIDKDGNKTPLNYKVPASWAADVVTPITNATINFTTGGQWNTAAVKGAEGKINQKFTINIDNTFPEGVQFKIQTTERNGDAGSIYAVFPAGEKTFSVDVEETVPGETITEIVIQNTVVQDPFKLVNCSVTMTELGGGEEAGEATALIDYPTKKDGITIGSGVDENNSQKYHANTDEVANISFGSGYTTDGVINGKMITLSVEGGFKTGDKVIVAGYFNNSDETKQAAVQIFTGA